MTTGGEDDQDLMILMLNVHLGRPVVSAVTEAFTPRFANAPRMIPQGNQRYYMGWGRDMSG
jgi:hypothetical protein